MMHQEVVRTTPGSGRADVLRLQALGYQPHFWPLFCAWSQVRSGLK
jgi:hypothetical protein